jgi:hypothetical protein
MLSGITPLAFVLALVAVAGTALFIAGDLVGPTLLRPIGALLAVGAYAAILVLHRPAKPMIQASTESRRPGARHVA